MIGFTKLIFIIFATNVTGMNGLSELRQVTFTRDLFWKNIHFIGQYIYFGSYNQKSPIIIVSLLMSKEMAAQKFKGLYFKDVLE